LIGFVLFGITNLPSADKQPSDIHDIRAGLTGNEKIVQLIKK
jgi:hypothetical protein